MTESAITDDDRPLIVVVDDDPGRRSLLESELSARYSIAYRVSINPSPLSAQSVLEEARAHGRPVALVLASQWMEEMDGAPCTQERVDRLLAFARTHRRAARLPAPRLAS